MTIQRRAAAPMSRGTVLQQDQIPDLMPTMGNPAAPIVVVCDSPSQELWRQAQPIGGKAFDIFRDHAEQQGFGKDDFLFVSPCGPMPSTAEGSDKREKAFIDQYRDSLRRTLAQARPRTVLYLGKTAGYALTGKPTKIMKQRGMPRRDEALGMPLLPLLSPGHVLRRPELLEIYQSDFNMLRILVDSDYSLDGLAENVGEVEYEWRQDISDILANRPSAISVDAEATGLRWYKPEVFPITVQMSWEAGKAIALPVSPAYFPEHFGMTRRDYQHLRLQLKELLEDPAVKKCGHNLKIDHHFIRRMGIEVRGWQIDTMQLAFVVDENMPDKSQDECVRRWVPEMAGYADIFNQETDKSQMITVPPDKMLPYAAGDADACFRLARTLTKLARADARQWKTYTHIQWPALRSFMDVVEPQGIMIDENALAELQTVLGQQTAREYRELIQMVPAAVRRKHAEAGLEFSRDRFVRDILFTDEGFGLKPVVFTKSTRKLGEDEQIPSVSTKDHLPYFDDHPFVAKLIPFQKLEKLRGTYVGVPGHQALNSRGETVDVEPTGFWKYIWDGRIHPGFFLHRTVTGRTASSDPNAQNFPKRGPLAKAYRKIFVPTPGYVFVECDLSQAELRIAAWMANDPAMLKVYREGRDIHEATAAGVMGLSIEQFRALPDDVRKKKRQDAKAVNFGFLYGMGWKKFMGYAKTEYGVTFTETEAKRIRSMFFKTYRRLEPWHVAMRQFVKKHGYVRSLHGALRRLPNIRSVDEIIRGECERQAINSPVQRFASDLGIMAVGRLCRDADPNLIRPVAFIHDAIVCEVKEEFAHEGAAWIKFYMESNPLENWFEIEPPLPIKADASIGVNLSDMEEMGERIQAEAPAWWNHTADGWNSREEQHEVQIASVSWGRR